MPTRKSTSAKGPRAARSSTPKNKVYRSMAEIRRTFYPKANNEQVRNRDRASNETFVRSSSKPGGAL